MHPRSILLWSLFLSGCAHDMYTPLPGTPSDPSKLSSSLHSCQHSVLHEYFASRSPSAVGLGVMTGGLVAGVIDTEHPYMTPDQINPAIEACMLQHGFVGTSVN